MALTAARTQIRALWLWCIMPKPVPGVAVNCSMPVSDERPAGITPGPSLSGTNLERAGDHNQRVTLHAIRVVGPITRADLRSTTGLTAAAITNITERLLKQRLILKAGRTRGTRGQPATKLIINPDGCFSMGLNVDRDHMTLVLVDFAGKVRARSSREVRFALPEAVLHFCRRSVSKLLDESQISANKVVGLGVAFPDDIQRAALPEQPPDYSMWGSVAVDTLLSDALSMPVFVENDAAAAESSHDTGSVTDRGAESGSGEASIRRIRTPCQIR